MIFAKLYLEHISEKQLIDTLSGNDQITYWSFILHDKDKFPSGELKKAHFHVIIDYVPTDKKGCKVFMSKIFTQDMLSGADIQTARNGQRVHRYLLHLDNLEKVQYEKEAIKTSDSEILEEYLLTQIKIGKREQALNDIFDFVEDREVKNGEVTSQLDLLKFCRSKGILDYYITHQEWINTALNDYFDTNFKTYKK